MPAEIRPDIMTSLETSGAEEMSRALDATGVGNVLREDENGNRFQYTVFAPSNSALSNYSANLVYTRRLAVGCISV